MRKTLTYIFFFIACLLVIWLFVTATSYTQLIVAVLLYPVLAYFALKIFPRRKQIVVQVPAKTPVKIEEVGTTVESQDVSDIDKRTFIKLIGATGLFFFLTSLFGKWAGSLPLSKSFIGQVSTTGNPPNSGGVGNSGSIAGNGYQISEVDDGGAVAYYGFTNNDGSWLIMKEDSDTSSFRYAKGGSNFPANWVNRGDLKYDYYYNLF